MRSAPFVQKGVPHLIKRGTPLVEKGTLSGRLRFGGGGLNLFDKARRVWVEFSAIGPSTHASSVAYYSFLSIVPLLALCISLVSLTGLDQQQVLDFLYTFVPDALREFVSNLVSDAFARAGFAFSLSTISLLWSASKGAKAMRVGLNAAYRVQETRGFVATVIISNVAVVTLGLLIAGTMWMIFGNSLLRALSQSIPGLHLYDGAMEFLEAAALLIAGVLVLALCYTWLPTGTRRFLPQLPGAACALVGCAVLSYGFRLYVDHLADYNVIYGSLATVAMLLFWMYLIFYVLIAGAFINRHLQDRALAANPSGRRLDR